MGRTQAIHATCGLPVICECGQNFPLSSDAANRFYFEPLEPLAESILAQDEMAYENLLAPLSAAQRFHYDVAESPCGYRVYNPSNDKSYTVVLGSLADTCQCGIWFKGSTCIHIESVRLKFGMPSRAQKIVDQKRFAYAWLDRTRFPARIRIGWFGSVKKKVETIVRNYSPISSADDLMQLADDFKSAGISFHVTPKVQATLADRNALPSDLDLARMVESKGRAILQGLIPALHGFQVEGAIFLAAAQRGVLLDEMGLGKNSASYRCGTYLKSICWDQILPPIGSKICNRPLAA